ncbi:hypothetical protein OJ998_20715 [Solirubrobacter taibaiensis]|nr:hypothetical protein [Solirubrobacter taibaiensis]
MLWEKLGRVYVASGEQPWAQTHAYIPTPLALGDRIRVFVAFLDERKVGRLGYVDVAAADPTRVIGVSENPVLDVGQPGTFDDNGVTPLSVFRRDGRIWLYYAGWQLGVQIRYYLFVGLAFSDDDGRSFQRYARVPVLDRSDAEPTLRTGCFVQSSADGFRMWYMAGDTWVQSDGRQMPSYGMRHIESADGMHWPESGQPSMEPQPPDEFGFGRPYVLQDERGYRIWYGIRLREKGYRLGYAESPDGLSWNRLDDQVGIDVSETGWDSEMVGYPWVHRNDTGTYLFYNGNNYGASGFGVARLLP